MIKISKENIDSFLASIVDTDDKEKYTEEFWSKIEEENPYLLDMILGFVENLETDLERSMYLDGLWMMYSLCDREIELTELENLNV